MTEPAERTELRGAGAGAATAGVACGPALTPPGFDCGKCGYDLSGMPVRRCPECGWVFGEQEMEEGARRAMAVALVKGSVDRLSRDSLRLLAGVFLLGVLLTGEVMTPMWAAALGAAAIGVTYAGGLFAACVAKGTSRAVVELAWARSVLWLGTPWLTAPLAVAGSWLALWLASALPPRTLNGLMASVMLILVIGLWGICGIRGVMTGLTRFRQTCAEYCARPGAWQSAFALVLLISVLITVAMTTTFFAVGMLSVRPRS